MSKRVSFEEIGGVSATFLAGEGVTAGAVVKVSGNDTAAVCVAGERFCGVTESVAGDGVCSVQVSGFATVKAGADVSAGWAALVADDTGGVRAAGDEETGLERLVVSAGDGVAVVLL